MYLVETVGMGSRSTWLRPFLHLPGLAFYGESLYRPGSAKVPFANPALTFCSSRSSQDGEKTGLQDPIFFRGNDPGAHQIVTGFNGLHPSGVFTPHIACNLRSCHASFFLSDLPLHTGTPQGTFKQLSRVTAAEPC